MALAHLHNKYLAGLALLLVAAVAAACHNDDSDDYSDAATAIVGEGDSMPSFCLYGEGGAEVTAESLKGQAYIMNFFDTRCPDCQQELKVLQSVYDAFGRQVPVLNVPRSQAREEVAAYWAETGLTMPVYTPADRELYYKFATARIPRTYVVDGEGRVQAAFADSPIADYTTLHTLVKQLDNEAAARKGTVRLKLRLSVGRSAADDYYFYNEYAISRLDIYFFEADGKEFVTKATVRNLTKVDDLPDTEYDMTYLYEDIRLNAGVYDIFAIANYEGAPEKPDSEEEFINMVDSITYSSGIEANMPDGGPVMTSRATAMLALDLVPWIGKSYEMRIDMERVLAKLQIGVSANTFTLEHEQRKYADINITNYKLVNLNSMYYLFQHRDSMTQLGPKPRFELPKHFSDYSDNGEQYVVDPLFYQKTQSQAAAATFGQYYKSWFGDFSTSDFASMPSANNYGYAYILENTAFKECQKNGYSPGIVFKAAVSPVFVYLYDNTQKTLQEERRPEYWPNTIYLYKYNFYESIQAVNMASGLALDELATYTDAQLKAYGIKQCKFNMGVYETYYTYWINHRNGSAGQMGPMEYGVVRNNFYRIIVTGVNGLGNSAVTPDIMRDNYPNSYADVSVD